MATKKKTAKKKASKPKPRKPVEVKRKTARQPRLPGMQDAKISGLHNAALDYAEIRDQRQELTTQEVDLKQRLIKLMHDNSKETYDYNGVHIELVHEDETVKVRIKRIKEGEDVEVDVPEPENAGELVE